MYIAEALVPIWIESDDGTDQTQTSGRPILIVVEALGATLRGQLLQLTESKAQVLPNEPFLMSNNVRVTLRFRRKDTVYTLSGVTEASEQGDSFHVAFDAVTREKISIFVGKPKEDPAESAAPPPPPKRSKEEQRKVRREKPPDGVERRVHARHELGASANLMVLARGGVIKCLVLELSLSGCRLFNEIPLSLEHDTAVEVEFTGHGYPFRLAAKVRVKADEHLIGLEFMNASKRTLDRLQDLVAELEEGQRVNE